MSLKYADYAGTCLICQGPIQIGDALDWTKHRGAAHRGCFYGKPPLPAPAASPWAKLAGQTVTINLGFGPQTGEVVPGNGVWRIQVPTKLGRNPWIHFTLPDLIPA